MYRNGGGWVQLTFHHICSGCGAYSITPTDMQSVLDWLSAQVTSGAVVVESTEQVMEAPTSHRSAANQSVSAC